MPKQKTEKVATRNYWEAFVNANFPPQQGSLVTFQFEETFETEDFSENDYLETIEYAIEHILLTDREPEAKKIMHLVNLAKYFYGFQVQRETMIDVKATLQQIEP